MWLSWDYNERGLRWARGVDTRQVIQGLAMDFMYLSITDRKGLQRLRREKDGLMFSEDCSVPLGRMHCEGHSITARVS